MDGSRFDQWTSLLARSVRSRRGVMQLGLAAVAAVTGGAVTSGDALACRRDRRKCSRDGQCCSGKCQRVRKGVKNKVVKRCDPAPGAFGCTVNRNSCQVGEELACPDRDDGFCVNLDNGRPFCALEIVCFDCKSDKVCQEAAPFFGAAVGQCERSCQACEEEGGGMCVFSKRLPPAP